MKLFFLSTKLSEEFFLKIQGQIDLLEAKKLIAKELKNIVPYNDRNKVMSIN